MREELAAIMKNIIEKGYSLEQAKASFINAGYDKREVEQAAEILTKGPSFQVQISSQPQTFQQLKPQPQLQAQPQLQRVQQAQKPKRRTLKIILIVILILIFLTAVGLVAYYFNF